MAFKTLLNLVKKKPDLAGILASFCNNNTSGKELLYKHYYGYVMAVVIRYTSNTHDSEELVNDSFMKIFKYAHSFKQPEDPAQLEKAFKGWIAKISSRTAIDFINKPKLTLQELELTENEHPKTIPEEMMKLNVQDLLKLLNGLPETQRLIFNLYEIEGFSHAEIGEMLGIQENISRVYLTRAKQKLRLLYQVNMESNGTY